MVFPAFLDACVLIPITLPDTLLRLAQAETCRPLWPDQVLDEVERNLYPHVTIQCVREQIAAYRKPTVTITDFLARLAKAAPNFAETVAPLLIRR